MRNTIVSALLSAVALSPLAYSSPIGAEQRDIVWDSTQGSSGNLVADNTPPAPTLHLNNRAIIDDQVPAATKKTRSSRASRPAPTIPAAPTGAGGNAPAGSAPTTLTYLPGAQGTLGAPGSQITWGARAVKVRQEEPEPIDNPDSSTSDEGEVPTPSSSEGSDTTIESREPDVADIPAKAPPRWGSWGQIPKPQQSASGKKPQGFRVDPNPAPAPAVQPAPAPEAAAAPPVVPVPAPVPAANPVPVYNPIPVSNPAPAQQHAPPKPATSSVGQGSPVVYSPDGSASLQISDSSISFFPSDGGATQTAHSGETTYGGSISNQISKREAEAAEAAKKPNTAKAPTTGNSGSQSLTITSSGVTFYPSSGGSSTTVTTGKNGKRDNPIIYSPAPGVWESLSLTGSSTTFYPAKGGKNTVQEGKREVGFTA